MALSAPGSTPALTTRPAGRRRRSAAVGLAVVAGLILLVIVGGGVLAGALNPNDYKPRMEAAVLRATGRTLTIGGDLRIGWFNGPRIKATDVSLSNIATGTRPQMATVGEVKARLSLTALLEGRIEIERLELIRPDLLLEIDAAGQPNWRFVPPPRETAANAAPAGPSRPRMPIAVRELRITDGTALLADDRSGRHLALTLRSMTGSAPDDSDRPTFTILGSVGTADIKLAGETGPLAQLTHPPTGEAPNGEAPAPWPVKLELTTPGAQATLTGTLDPALLPGAPADPLHPGRYDLALTAAAQDLSTFAPLLPTLPVPPLKAVHLKLSASGTGRGLPELQQLDLSAGRSDLGALVPGLMLDQLSIVDASNEAPLQAKAAGSYAGASFTLAADLGAPAALRPGQPDRGPFPVALAATAAGARVTAKGGILHPRMLHGLDLTVDAQVPDLGAFAPLLHRAVPALTNVSAHAGVTDGAEGFLHGVTLGGLQIKTAGTDATGDLAIAWSPRPSIAGHLAAASLNAGDLTSAFVNPIKPPPRAVAPPGAPPGATPGAPPGTTTGTTTGATTGATPGASAVAPPPAASAAPPAGPRHLISDRPLRFARWLATDADLQIGARTVTWQDEIWHNLAAHLVVAGGKLRLDGAAADLPSGHAEAAVQIDAAGPMPAVAARVRAPGVSVQPLLALLGLPEAASGRLEIDANLHGIGHSLHELAATADGTLGLAMVGGSVDGGAAQAWVAELLRRAALPAGARLSGRTDIQCLALRLDLARGLGTFRALALQTPLLSLTGGGGVNLADETVAMRVRAVASVGIGIAVPFDVSGALRAPQVRVNIASGAASALEGATGLMIGRLGGEGAAALGGPSCGAELAVARGGWTGKLPATATTAPAGPAAAPAHPAERAAKAFRWLLR